MSGTKDALPACPSGLRCPTIHIEKAALVTSHSQAKSILHGTGINLLFVGGCKPVLHALHKCPDLNSAGLGRAMDEKMLWIKIHLKTHHAFVPGENT